MEQFRELLLRRGTVPTHAAGCDAEVDQQACLRLCPDVELAIAGPVPPSGLLVELGGPLVGLVLRLRLDDAVRQDRPHFDFVLRLLLDDAVREDLGLGCHHRDQAEAAAAAAAASATEKREYI